MSDRLISSVSVALQEKWKEEKKKGHDKSQERMTDKEQEKNLLPRFTLSLFVSHILIQEEEEEETPFPSLVKEGNVWKRGNIHVTLIQYRRWTSDVSHEDKSGKKPIGIRRDSRWSAFSMGIHVASCLVSFSSRPLSFFDTLRYSKGVTRRLSHSIISVWRPKITCFITCLLLPTVTGSLREGISS